MLLAQVGYCTDRTLQRQVTVHVLYGTVLRRTVRYLLELSYVLCRTVRYLLELSVRTVPYGTVPSTT